MTSKTGLSDRLIRVGEARKRFSFLALFACLAIGAAFVTTSCSLRQSGMPAPDLRTGNDLLAEGSGGKDWPTYGGLSDEQHFSSLDQINTANVGRLGLAWAVDLPVTANPSTAPIAIDGVIYMSYGYSVVYAFDAISGQQLWSYDPKVTEVAGLRMRNGWGIRGIAYWQGKLFTGTQDGRLIALDAHSGKLLWSVQTLDKDSTGYITGAPRAFDGLVAIGFGGADVGANRGYVTAYDADTGKQVWRFYTVPGNPANGFEDEAMRRAAKTWNGEWWRSGGGGTVWNAITYDRKLDRVYIGTGNGNPYVQSVRSPKGGDNLFLCSIVALDARTGKYLWHYQTTPGEEWDYNSTMDITLADLPVGGKIREVLLHAPKNGFMYVIMIFNFYRGCTRHGAPTENADHSGPADPASRLGMSKKGRGRPPPHRPSSSFFSRFFVLV